METWVPPSDDTEARSLGTAETAGQGMFSFGDYRCDLAKAAVVCLRRSCRGEKKRSVRVRAFGRSTVFRESVM